MKYDFFVAVLIIITLDLLSYLGIRKTFPKFANRQPQGLKWAFRIQCILSLAIVIGGFSFKGKIRDYRLFALYYYLFGILLFFYIPKIIFSLFFTVNILTTKIRTGIQRTFRESRYIISKTGFILGLCSMIVIFWGIVVGRYDFTVETVRIYFPDLPPAFDGFKIAQVSDVHAGSSAGHIGRFEKAVQLTNAETPDIIVFTGDMVNNFAEETEPLIPIFSRFEAPYGKYAILGNHDYGGYYNWESLQEQNENHQKLKQNITSMGFRILDNDAEIICIDSSGCIAIVGIENWGKLPRNPKKGDIDLALSKADTNHFKVLLSHDPSHWHEKVLGVTDIALTLSGHTHGLQMGVRIGKNRYSPAKFQFKHWAGLCYEDGQYLYVNRGLGVIGFPGRFGMSPEITIIELKKK